MKYSDFALYIQDDVFAGLEGITFKSMFGGYGLYKNGVIFGLIADDELYFKTDDSFAQEFEKKGGRQFIYTHKKGKVTTMPYWTVPDEVLSDSQKLESWIDRSVSISLLKKK